MTRVTRGAGHHALLSGAAARAALPAGEFEIVGRVVCPAVLCDEHGLPWPDYISLEGGGRE